MTFLRAAGADASLYRRYLLCSGWYAFTAGFTFTYDNSSSAVNGSAFQGHFRFTLAAGCPSI
ncbi:MAG: hypothetical protein R2824_27680 [Saprospiraceae bacterium]